MLLYLIESCHLYAINVSHLFLIQKSFRHPQCLVAATHWMKYLYVLFLICYLLILFDGLSIDETFPIHLIHSVLLVFYRDMPYPFLSDLLKIKVFLCLDFHYYWSSLLSLSVSFPVLLYSFGHKGTTNYIKDTLGDLNSVIIMFCLLFSTPFQVIVSSACFCQPLNTELILWQRYLL